MYALAIIIITIKLIYYIQYLLILQVYLIRKYNNNYSSAHVIPLRKNNPQQHPRSLSVKVLIRAYKASGILPSTLSVLIFYFPPSSPLQIRWPPTVPGAHQAMYLLRDCCCPLCLGHCLAVYPNVLLPHFLLAPDIAQ